MTSVGPPVSAAGSGPRPNHLPELDGLRGGLALWVVVAHVLCWSGAADVPLPRRLESRWREVTDARAAVEVFIILSGFAIAAFLAGRRPTYRAFLANRVWRIYPVYTVCLALAYLTAPLTPDILANAGWRDTTYFPWLRRATAEEARRPALHLLAHATLLNGLVPSRVLPETTSTFLPPAWSLTLEWQFYLVAPLVVAAARRPSGLVAAAVVTAAGERLLRYGFVNSIPALLPAELLLFVTGAGCYHLRTAMLGAGVRSALPAAAVFALAVWSPRSSVALMIWAVAYAAILDPTAWGIGRVGRLMRSGPAVRLGAISYPLYLVHWPLIVCGLWLLLRWRPSLSTWQAVGALLVTALPAALAAAVLLHVTVERPGLRLGRRVAGDRSGRDG